MAKKNQHYIPKFYLRYFSYKKNEKEIGIFNIHNNFFSNKVPLKSQGSKSYYYGKDEKLENTFSQMEGCFATTFSNIIKEENVVKKDKKELYELLTFVLLTDVRNPIAIENIKGVAGKINDLIDGTVIPDLSHDESVKIAMSTIKEILPFLLDLEYKLLINKTSTPFISSDFPVVKYNQYLETKSTFYSITGYRSKGLKIFLPISPTLLLVFFDKSVYKVGNKKDNTVDINSLEDVNQLNLLQFINNMETIFFNDDISEKYILKLNELSKRYMKANKTNHFKANLKNCNGIIEKDSLIISQQSDCKTNLKLNVIKLHSGNNKRFIDTSKIQLRC